MTRFFQPSLPFDTHPLSIFCSCSFCAKYRQKQILAKTAVYIADLEVLEWGRDIAPLETPPESITTYCPGARK